MIAHMQLPLLTSLTVLALSLVASNVTDAAPGSASAKTSIPKIARIGKIQIGYSTQEDLTKHWGEGKTVTGGHPNSGRLWRVKGTSWTIATDGFEYSKRGLLVDSFEIYEDQNPAKDVPVALLAKRDFTWLGDITPGMSRDEVMRVLKSESLSVSPTKEEGDKIGAKGFHALLNNIELKTWTASLSFTNGVLCRLTLTADAEKH